MSKRFRGFAICPAGLEPPLLEELQQQPFLQNLALGRGGVWFESNATGFARANLWCRIPTRLLLTLSEFRLENPDDLYKAAHQIPWEHFFGPEQTIRVDVNQGSKPLFSLALPFAALKVKDGICDRLRSKCGRRPSVDTKHPHQRVWLFIQADKATLSLDTSGEPLFKRGWRQEKGQAPLRENLAAALVSWSNYKSGLALLDPFCGSGTLVIESLQTMAGLAPGYLTRGQARSFACERFSNGSAFEEVNWRQLREEAKEAWERASQLSVSLPVIGADIDSRLINAAKANASRALPESLAMHIEWRVSDFFQIEKAPAQEGILLTNPPFGQRLQFQDPSDLVWRRLSEGLKHKFHGWTAWLLSDNLKLEQALRLKAARKIRVFNGDIECRWMRFDMVSGSARKTSL